jgi:hypothetical protein
VRDEAEEAVDDVNSFTLSTLYLTRRCGDTLRRQ